MIRRKELRKELRLLFAIANISGKDLSANIYSNAYEFLSHFRRWTKVAQRFSLSIWIWRPAIGQVTKKGVSNFAGENRSLQNWSRIQDPREQGGGHPKLLSISSGLNMARKHDLFSKYAPPDRHHLSLIKACYRWRRRSRENMSCHTIFRKYIWAEVHRGHRRWFRTPSIRNILTRLREFVPSMWEARRSSFSWYSPRQNELYQKWS